MQLNLHSHRFLTNRGGGLPRNSITDNLRPPITLTSLGKNFFLWGSEACKENSHDRLLTSFVINKKRKEKLSDWNKLHTKGNLLLFYKIVKFCASIKRIDVTWKSGAFFPPRFSEHLMTENRWIDNELYFAYQIIVVRVTRKLSYYPLS